MKNRVINFYPWHFEIKKGILVFFGERKENGERHELRIHFSNRERWFRFLAEESIKYLRKRREEIEGFILNIRKYTL